jgi:hypothetical protein
MMQTKYITFSCCTKNKNRFADRILLQSGKQLQIEKLCKLEVVQSILPWNAHDVACQLAWAVIIAELIINEPGTTMSWRVSLGPQRPWLVPAVQRHRQSTLQHLEYLAQ